MKSNTANRLKELLSNRNLRQVDVLNLAEPFCKKYGVKLSKSDLSQYVTGKVVPGQDKLLILGMALNVSEAWLMGYDVPMEKASQDLLYKAAEDRVLHEEFDTLTTEEKEAALNHVRSHSPEGATKENTPTQNGERDFAKNEHEEEMLLLARHMAPIPEEDREQLKDQFKKSIDLYLKARGISTTEDT